MCIRDSHIGLRYDAGGLALLHDHYRVNLLVHHDLGHSANRIIRRTGNNAAMHQVANLGAVVGNGQGFGRLNTCLLYTSRCV